MPHARARCVWGWAFTLSAIVPVTAGCVSRPVSAPTQVAIASINVNGTRLFYETLGTGPVVVLVSGGGLLDHRMWDEQFVDLAADRRVIRYDIRGIGRSARPKAPFSHSEDLAALLRELRTGPVDLVGLSFGAAIALDYALEHPESVDRLVLASPGLSDDRAANLKGALALSEMAREHGVAEVVELLVNSRTLLAAPSPVSQQRLRVIYTENADAFLNDWPLIRWWNPVGPPVVGRLSNVRARTLVLVGARDGEETGRVAEILATSIPGASKTVIAGAGHLMQMDAPVEFGLAVRSFLAERR